MDVRELEPAGLVAAVAVIADETTATDSDRRRAATLRAERQLGGDGFVERRPWAWVLEVCR